MEGRRTPQEGKTWGPGNGAYNQQRRGRNGSEGEQRKKGGKSAGVRCKSAQQGRTEHLKEYGTDELSDGLPFGEKSESWV